MTLILVVDDDPGLRKVLVRVLQHAGYSDAIAMPRAEDAETLLERMTDEARAEALVMMDVLLHPSDKWPDGCAAGRAIARRWPPVRLLFMSGHDQRDLIGRCPGMIPYITKGNTSPLALTNIVADTLRGPPWRPKPDPEIKPQPHRRGRDHP